MGTKTLTACIIVLFTISCGAMAAETTNKHHSNAQYEHPETAAQYEAELAKVSKNMEKLQSNRDEYMKDSCLSG